jgi:hypothetical protein
VNFDLSGQPDDWVPQFQPPVPTPPPRPVVMEVRGPDTSIHFVLTILTCGLWFPIWIIAAIVGRRRIVIR